MESLQLSIACTILSVRNKILFRDQIIKMLEVSHSKFPSRVQCAQEKANSYSFDNAVRAETYYNYCTTLLLILLVFKVGE